MVGEVYTFMCLHSHFKHWFEKNFLLIVELCLCTVSHYKYLMYIDLNECFKWEGEVKIIYFIMQLIQTKEGMTFIFLLYKIKLLLFF